MTREAGTSMVFMLCSQENNSLRYINTYIETVTPALVRNTTEIVV
jgi:hypothetical protein